MVYHILLVMGYGIRDTILDMGLLGYGIWEVLFNVMMSSFIQPWCIAFYQNPASTYIILAIISSMEVYFLFI